MQGNFAVIAAMFDFAIRAAAPISVFMKKLLIAALCVLLPLAAQAQERPEIVDTWDSDRTQVFDAADLSLDAFRWIARPLVVFAESPFDPLFQQQMELIAARADELALRDVIVIVDTDPDAASDIRRALRPRAFMLALVGKDGQTKLRKPSPWDVRELSRSIDKMPLRQQEIRDRRGSDS